MRGFSSSILWWHAARAGSCGELVMQTNEHTNRCLIKQSAMLTFTHGSCRRSNNSWRGVIWRGENSFASLSPPLRQFSFRGEREKEERERKQGKQAEEVCGEQTEDNGVWVSGGVFGVIGPERQRGRDGVGERARAEEGRPSLSLG